MCCCCCFFFLYHFTSYTHIQKRYSYWWSSSWINNTSLLHSASLVSLRLIIFLALCMYVYGTLQLRIHNTCALKNSWKIKRLRLRFVVTAQIIKHTHTRARNQRLHKKKTKTKRKPFVLLHTTEKGQPTVNVKPSHSCAHSQIGDSFTHSGFPCTVVVVVVSVMVCCAAAS